jgi:antirestriction protein
MKTNILATEIATLERKIEDTKSAVVKKTLRVRLATLKKQFSDAKDSSKTKNDILSKAKVKVEEMTKKDFNEYIKKLSKNDEYKFLGLMSKEEIIDDIKEVAKPVGWRFRGSNNRVPSKKQVTMGRKSGDVYYENRSNHSDVSRVVRLAKGGEVDNILEVKDGEDTFYLTYIDPTHFYLSNTRDFKGSAYHSGQFRDRPFYNDVVSWLKSNRPKMANGGGVDEMLYYVVGKKKGQLVDVSTDSRGEITPFTKEDAKTFAKSMESSHDYNSLDILPYRGKNKRVKMAKGGGVSSADKRVTESKYDDMMGVLPPIMFDTLDGEKLRGFAVDEPSDHKMIDGKMKEVYQGYYEVKEGGKTNYYAIGEYVYFDDKGKAFRHEKGSANVSDEPSMAELIDEIVDEKSIPEPVVEQMIQEYGLDESNVKDWFDEHYEGEYNSDEDLAYGYVDMVGGLDALGKQTLETYFDYSAFGRDLAINDFHERDGHYFRYKNGGMMAKGGAMGSNNKNGKYLDSISSDKKSKILKNIASHYGISVSDAEEEVRDEDAEMLYEYIANDQSLRMDVYNDMKRGMMAKGGGFDQYGNPYGFDNEMDSVYEYHHKPENKLNPYKVWDKIDGVYVAEFPSRQRAIEWIERQQYRKGGGVGDKKYVKVDNKSDAENILFYADKQDIASSYRKSEKDGSYTIIFEKKLEITNDMQPRIKEILENQKTKMATGGNLGEPHRTNTK